MKGRVLLSSREDEGETTSQQKRKESEFLLQFDESLSRDPTIYDYEKIVNVISLTINKYKELYLKTIVASKSLAEDSVDLFVSGIHDKSVLKIVTISRVFCFIDAELNLKNPDNQNYLQDFDTSQFLSLLSLIQKLLRFKIEGFFSVALNLGSKTMLLKDIEDVKSALPFRSQFTGHLSNLCKIILTHYMLIVQFTKAAPHCDFLKSLESEFSLAAYQKAFPNYLNIKDSLLAGYHLLLNLVKILEYGMERGIDKQSSPVIQLWLDCRDLLKDSFTRLGIVDSLPRPS